MRSNCSAFTNHLSAYRAGKRLADPEPVRVSIESLSMSPAPGGQMQVQFVQRFESSSNSFAIRRELLMVRLDNNWFIAEERVTDVL